MAVVTLSPTTLKPFVCFISLKLYSLLQYGTRQYTPSSKHCKCLFHFDYDATFQRLEEQPPHGLLEGNRTTKRGGTCLIDSRESERSRRGIYGKRSRRWGWRRLVWEGEPHNNVVVDGEEENAASMKTLSLLYVVFAHALSTTTTSISC